MSRELDELAGVVDLLAAVADLDDPQLFAPVVLRKLAVIVPCDALIYNEIDVASATVRWTAHPLQALYRSAGYRSVAAPQEWHSLDAYNKYLRTANYEFRMTFTLREPAGAVVGIALNRFGHDFTSHERDIVALLCEPLGAAHERLGRRAQAGPAPSPDAEVLTDRERQVLELAAAGRTDSAIGHLLGCSRRTISKHLENTYRKLGVTNRVAAIARIR